LILESVVDPDLRIEAELAASSFHLASRASGALRRLERYRDADLPIGPGQHFMQVMLAHRSLLVGDPCSATTALLDRALVGSELFSEQSLVAVFAAMDLVLTDRLEDAEQLCTAFIEQGQRRGARSVVSSFAFPRAFASLRRGRLRDAEADARWSFEGSLALVPRSESGPLLALAFLLDALTELGDFRGADEALARVDTPDGEPPELVAWAFVLEARGRLRIAQGRLREGLVELSEAGERWQRLSCPCPSTWREDAALALAGLGEHDEARRLAAKQLELAQANGLPLRLGTATRVAGAVAPRAHRIPLLHEAVDLLGQTGARLELAKAQLELGAALRRNGHRVDACDHLRQALELAHRAAATRLAARAREELLAAGGRPRKPVFTGLEALTASELRVARLAAKGLTNREIAESLFVTQRTVETHLRHAFQKLDISRREDLPAELAVPNLG
jgi:ATP/maltotriose-dependent transcriptional regulator MalT